MSLYFFRSRAIIMVSLCACVKPFAQEVPQQSYPLCVCTSDATCYSGSGCDVSYGCETKEFTIDCTSGGRFKFELVLACENCEHCLACAIITNPQGEWVGSRQVGCNTQGCGSSDYVNLEGGVTYTLHACLVKCPDPDTCAGGVGCLAKARVYDSLDNCTTPCNW
jgi:hypothetical protein